MEGRHYSPAGFKVVRPLGQGSFGGVWLCQYKETGELLAIKKTAKKADELSRELYILKVLKNKPYIVPMLDYFYT